MEGQLRCCSRSVFNFGHCEKVLRVQSTLSVFINERSCVSKLVCERSVQSSCSSSFVIHEPSTQSLLLFTTNIPN